MTLASWADCAHNDADDDDMDVKYSVYPRGLERIEVCATIVVFGKRELFAIRLASFIYFLVLRNRTAISIVILFVTSVQLNFSHRKIFIRKCGERDYSSLKLVIIFSRLLFNEEMIDSNRNNILEIYLFIGKSNNQRGIIAPKSISLSFNLSHQKILFIKIYYY